MPVAFSVGGALFCLCGAICGVCGVIRWSRHKDSVAVSVEDDMEARESLLQSSADSEKMTCTICAAKILVGPFCEQCGARMSVDTNTEDAWTNDEPGGIDDSGARESAHERRRDDDDLENESFTDDEM